MEETELAFTPALDQAAMVRRGEVSPVELVELYLERIDRLNPELDAYLTVAADLARDEARAAEASRRGGTDGLPPFLGVPISIKDLNDTAGIRTTHGTAGWHDRVPDTDEEVVARVKQAGFVILGKTNTPEFGSAPVAESPGYPPGRNPWDPERTPGGSSGGAAAATAAALCPVAHGSDGGGSIRIPASLCGLFGIKPSRGRVSGAPGAPSFIGVQGPLARTVADGAALLDAMAGYATGDPWWAPPPSRPFADEVGAPPDRLRVALATEPFLTGITVAPANREVAEQTAALLESLGHHVEPARPEWPTAAIGEEIATVGAQLAAREPELPRPETLDPVNQILLESGRLLPASMYVAAMDDLVRRARVAVAFWHDYDVLLTPTVPIPAPPIGEYTSMAEREDLREYMTRTMVDRAEMPHFGHLGGFTAPWNVTGQPAVTLPLGEDEDGLPVGVQLVGPPAGEATLIRVSAQLEAARPWLDRRPPMAC